MSPHRLGWSLFAVVVFIPFVCISAGVPISDVSNFLQAFQRSRGEMQADLEAMVQALDTNLTYIKAPTNLLRSLVQLLDKSLDHIRHVRSENINIRNQVKNDVSTQEALSIMGDLELALELHLETHELLAKLSAAVQQFGDNINAARKVLGSTKKESSNWLNDMTSLRHALEGMLLTKETSLRAYKALRVAYLSAQGQMQRNAAASEKILRAMKDVSRTVKAQSSSTAKALVAWSEDVTTRISLIRKANSDQASKIDEYLQGLAKDLDSFEKITTYLDQWYIKADSLKAS